MVRPTGAELGWLPMTYTTAYARSGLTAIAAVLALSSTPLTAQETATPPGPAAETPADPPPVADPLAPEPDASEPAAAEAEPAPPATTRGAPPRARTAARARAPAARNAAPVSPTPPAEAIAEPLPAPPVAATPPAEPVPPPAEQPVAYDWMADESLPIAAGAGLGLIALAGLGLAVGRRRRRRLELDHIRANQQYLAEHPPAPMPRRPADKPMPNDNEPGFVRAQRPGVTAAPDAAARTDAPRTRLPEGFDLSRYGPHVRAAYLGPTPDNPSLSLKYRLRRAAAMDQRVRLEAERRPNTAQPAARPVRPQAPAWRVDDQGFMIRRAGSGQASKPAWHR